MFRDTILLELANYGMCQFTAKIKFTLHIFVAMEIITGVPPGPIRPLSPGIPLGPYDAKMLVCC